MSMLKSPDNATLPEPIVSPGREFRRREARGRKMIATLNRAARETIARNVRFRRRSGQRRRSPSRSRRRLSERGPTR